MNTNLFIFNLLLDKGFKMRVSKMDSDFYKLRIEIRCNDQPFEEGLDSIDDILRPYVDSVSYGTYSTHYSIEKYQTYIIVK